MKMTRREWIEENEGGVLLADGFDEAILGVIRRPGQPPVVIYDREACIEILRRPAEGCVRRRSWEEAEEHFSFNVEGAWAGEGTPGFLMQPEEE